jgi:DNA-binding response OmpR family regulator
MHSQGGDSLDEVGSSPVVYRLQAQALIYESAPGRFAFFSPLFESFVRQKLEADRDVQVEAIGTPEDARRILDALGLDTGTKEGRLAYLLATHAGEVLTDEYLLDEIWGERGQEHALYTAVARLRSRMRQHKDTLGRIVRDRKSGYYYVHE